jgi:Mg-chelatase subunit ChlD
MFVVDRSTSMARHWDTVQRSIDRVVVDNPEVRFGFSGFPSRVGIFEACTVGESWPHVPIQRDGGRAIRDWFAANDVAGATPLLNAMQWLADHVDALWGPQPAEGVRGWLVVLSDGQDTCDCDNFEEDPDVVEACNREVSADMAGRARRLREQGIRTYVIGYTFGEDPLQIDSIAQEGGTGLMEHIAAGNEATLDNAFAQIVDDVKDCPR